MTTPTLKKAQLIPFNGDKPIPFDFNPETLTLKVSSGEQRGKGRLGHQKTQNVGASQATLSFECIFDSTRPSPSDGPGAQTESVEKRDVRRRTRAIADLLQVIEKGRQPFPVKVRFLWGHFLFDGLITQHQEVFDYFSAAGVPLRSKVSLTLTESNFRYVVDPKDAEPLPFAAVEEASERGRQAASALTGSRRSRARAEQALATAIVPGRPQPSPVELGNAVGAGLPLEATEVVDLFGGAAVPGGLDLARSGLPIPPTAAGQRPAGRPAVAWARDAAPPLSQAAGLATRVVAQRLAGLDPKVATGLSAPPPIRGHAPLRKRMMLEPPRALFPSEPPASVQSVDVLPRWDHRGPRQVSLGLQGPGGGMA